MKHSIANIVATVIALLVGAATIWVSLRYLKHPEEGYSWAAIRDWVVLGLSGFTTGTIAWFVTWGHFQDEGADAPPALCPLCGGPVKKTPYSQTKKGILFALAGHIALGEVWECEKCQWKNTDKRQPRNR